MQNAKTVLIAGASRGIGRACALKFAKNGHRVIINYNKGKNEAQELVNIINENGGYAVSYQADVSDAAEVEEMFSKINERFGGVDILINNAGIAKTMMFCDMSEKDWDEVFGTNVKGMFNCTKQAISYMVNKKYGKIVNISSIWGMCGASPSEMPGMRYPDPHGLRLYGGHEKTYRGQPQLFRRHRQDRHLRRLRRM